MDHLRMPESALWEAIQALDTGEVRLLRARLRDKKLRWLFDRLRAMDTFSEPALREAFRRKFSRTTPEVLRSCKRKLWDFLEETLPFTAEEIIAGEIRVWQRFWLSVILWHRGVHSAAEVLWHQAMHEAVEMKWYETALWGISLLELYARDFHRLASTQSVAAWTEALNTLLRQRYKAIGRKIAALERYVQSRQPHGWVLPSLPDRDEWTRYMRAYTRMLDAGRHRDFSRALHNICQMLIVLLEKDVRTSPYYRYNLAASLMNMGILLFNMEQWAEYEEWHYLWQRLWERGFFPPMPRYQELHRSALTTRLAYLVQAGRWAEARTFWMQEQMQIEHFVFHSTVNISYRFFIALHGYLILLLHSPSYRHAINWRLKLEKWMESESLREYPGSLWWHFLRWYEAYRYGDRRWMRHWYRRLLRTWKAFETQAAHWKPVLRLTRLMSSGLPITVQRYAARLDAHWQVHPSEKSIWEEERSFFPMIAFVRGITRRQSVENVPYTPSPAPPLTRALVRRIQKIFRHISHLIS